MKDCIYIFFILKYNALLVGINNLQYYNIRNEKILEFLLQQRNVSRIGAKVFHLLLYRSI